MSSSTPDGTAARLEAAAREVLALAEQALAAEATQAIPDETIQQLLTAATRLFAHKVESEQRYFLPLTGRDAVTPTDAAVLITELLRAVNLNLFDLSMWAGRRETMDDLPG
jgi:hypothetical protein